MNPIITNKPGKNTTNIFIIFCIFFQIISILGCSYLLYTSSEKYNKLVEIESSNFDAFQKWTYTSNQNFIRLFEVLQTEDNRQVDSLYANRRLVNMGIEDYINSLHINSHINIKDDSSFQAMIANRVAYFENVDNFIVIKKSASKESSKYFFTHLKPSFLAFQDKLGNFVQYYQENISQYNNQIFQSSKYSLWGILLVGLMPIVGLFIILVISFVYLLWLMNKLDFVNDSIS